MPNLCGVNQKLLAEALSSVKRGKTAARFSELNGSTDVDRKLGGSGKAPSPPPSGSSSTTSRSSKTSKLSPSSSSRASNHSTESTDETEGTESEEDSLPTLKCEPPVKCKPKFRKYEFDDFQLVKVLGKGSFGKVCYLNASFGLICMMDSPESYTFSYSLDLAVDKVDCTNFAGDVGRIERNRLILCHQMPEEGRGTGRRRRRVHHDREKSLGFGHQASLSLSFVLHFPN